MPLRGQNGPTDALLIFSMLQVRCSMFVHEVSAGTSGVVDRTTAKVGVHPQPMQSGVKPP